MKLIPMTDFVLHESFGVTNEIINESEFFLKVKNYAQFLKQLLKLEMFVPCDEEGNVLVEPKRKDYFLEYRGVGEEHPNDILRIEYQKAKEKVLFEGFYRHHGKIFSSHTIILETENIGKKWFTIESLSKNSVKDLTLTPAAIKQLGL